MIRIFRRALIGTAVGGTLMLGSAAAHAFTLDFETFTHGQVISENSVVSFGIPDPVPGLSVTLRTDNYATSQVFSQQYDFGVVFDTAVAGSSADPDLGPFFDFDENHSGNQNPQVMQGLPDGYSPGNVLIIQNDSDDAACRPDGICDNPNDERNPPAPIGKHIFEFGELVDIDSVDFFDVEEGSGAIWALDADDIIIGAAISVPTNGGDDMYSTIIVDKTGVKKLVIEIGGSGALDSIVGDFTTTTQVPEPTSMSLFGLGLVGLAYVNRRRRRSANKA